MKGFVNFNGDLRSTWNKSRINFSGELEELDRRMLRDCWKSFILLLVKKKRWKNNSAIVFPSLESSRLVSTISLNKLDERLSRAIYYTTGVRTGVTGD